MQKVLHEIFLRSPQNLFDEFQIECQKWYEQPAHTLTEMRTRDNKKIRGDIFEDFTVLFLKYARDFDDVWRLGDVPDEVLDKLGLKKNQDMGIDIVAKKGDKYYAVQCKYKKHTSFKKNILSWKQLSTFYALCLRTGPWEKYIVVTNCEYTRHAGKKSPKDVSICLKTLQGITKEQWANMCQLKGNQIIQTSAPLSLEELRAARLARFAQTGDNTPHTSSD
jgi:predicted helicase